MENRPQSRFEIIVEEGSPRGDLYELEQSTFFHVVDRLTDSIVMTFRGTTEAALSRDSGLWEDYQYSGVRQVEIDEDGDSVLVSYFDGGVQRIPLPRNSGTNEAQAE